MNTNVLSGGTELAASYVGFLCLHQISQEARVAIKKNSNTGKKKKGTDPKKRKPKSDKARFIFGRDMSVDGMIGSLKKMAEDIGMEFLPVKTEKDQSHKERDERR